MNMLILLLIALAAWLLIFHQQREQMSTSPGVFDQLAANSGYYPYWQYGWPYGRRRHRGWWWGWYPWNYGDWTYSRPWGWY
jgi:hypothetical protein